MKALKKKEKTIGLDGVDTTELHTSAKRLAEEKANLKPLSTPEEHSARFDDDGKKIKLFNARDVVRDKMLLLQTDLITTIVTDKTISGYYKQIAHNFTIGMKAGFLIKRDLADAKASLTNNGDFADLGDLLSDLSEDLSKSTISKWISIGKSDYCNVLHSEGIIPESWTTQYYLTTLTQEEREKVKPILSPNTTVSDVKTFLNIAQKKKDVGEVVYTFKNTLENPINVFQIAVQTRGADSNVLYKLEADLKDLIDKTNQYSLGRGYKVDGTDCVVEALTRNAPSHGSGTYIKQLEKRLIANFISNSDEAKKQSANTQTANDLKVLQKYNVQHLVQGKVGGEVKRKVSDDDFTAWNKLQQRVSTSGSRFMPKQKKSA